MKRSLLFLLLACAAARPGAAATDWPVLQSVPVASGFVQPTYVTSARDGTGRLFVVQQPGQVVLVSGTAASATPFLDISNEVSSQQGTDVGLLSIAFPPGYAAKGHFYAVYTRAADTALPVEVVLSRFSLTADPNVADPASEEVLLVIPQDEQFHSAGQLQFGPDGYLYMSKGDGGPQGDPGNYGQRLDTLRGKLLRLDVENGPGATTPYRIPADNPFVKRAGARPEIWARGLRNPWRFSFDRQTGDLYLGDVGFDSYEEADFQRAGKGGLNYGWRIREGFHKFLTPPNYPISALEKLTKPISEQIHSGKAKLNEPTGNSITGGYVYRNTVSKRMEGIYVYADFVSENVWGVVHSGDRWITKLLLNPGAHISTFGEDESGELYYADYSTGTLYHLQDSGAVWTPTILPNGGTFKMPKTIIIRSETPGAKIHYTINGNDPAETDPVVPATGKVVLRSQGTLKAQAYRADLQPSGVAAATFYAP